MGGKIHPYFWVDTHLEVFGENQYRMENVAMDFPDHFGQPAHFFLRFSIRGALQAAIDKAKKIEKAGRFLEDLLLWRLGRALEETPNQKVVLSRDVLVETTAVSLEGAVIIHNYSCEVWPQLVGMILLIYRLTWPENLMQALPIMPMSTPK